MQSKNPIKNEHFKKIALILTTACNMRCKYCFESEGSYKPIFMTDEIIEQALKRTLSENIEVGERVIIELFGGEPTLSEKQIHKVYECIKKYNIYNKEIVIWITTNLLVSNYNIWNIIKNAPYETKVTVSILLDKESHDADRIDAAMVGTYDRVRTNLLELIEFFKDANIPVQCHQVLSPKVLKMKTLDKILEASTLLMLEHKNVYVSTSPVSTGSTMDDYYLNEEIEYLIREFEKNTYKYKELLGGIPEEWLSEYLGHWSAKAVFHQKTTKMAFCQDLNRHVTVGVDGNTYSCHRMYLGSEMAANVVSNVHKETMFSEHYDEYVRMIKKSCAEGTHEYQEGFLLIDRKSEFGHDCKNCLAGRECNPCYVPMIGEHKDTKPKKDCIFARSKCYWKFQVDLEYNILKSIEMNNYMLILIKDEAVREKIRISNKMLEDVLAATSKEQS
ncbi:MAG: radical SAM protein [Fusobacteriaceae bacterium]